MLPTRGATRRQEMPTLTHRRPAATASRFPTEPTHAHLNNDAHNERLRTAVNKLQVGAQRCFDTKKVVDHVHVLLRHLLKRRPRQVTSREVRELL